MNPLLTIVVPVYNASGFLDNLLYSLHRLIFYDFKVLICAKAKSKRQKNKIEKTAKKYKKTEVFFHNPATSGSTSYGKGGALDLAIAKINTPYGVMMDVDAIFLKKHWDKILIDEFNDKIKIAGAPQGSVKYPMDFPDSYLTLFDAKVFKFLNISMMPGDMAKGQDVGWEMYDKFTKAGYKAIALVPKNTRDYKRGPFKDLIGVGEYYLAGDSHIFASHFARGCSRSGAAKYMKGANFLFKIPKIGGLLRILRGKREKKKWLKICRAIVDKQT